jgi:hypothetical protein
LLKPESSSESISKYYSQANDTSSTYVAPYHNIHSTSTSCHLCTKQPISPSNSPNMTPKVPTVNVIKTTNSLASQGSVNPEMMAQLPHNTVDDAVKTTNSLRSQYSVEVIDPEILTLLRHRFKKQGAENSICTEVVCLRCRPSTEILSMIHSSERRSFDVILVLTST